MLAGSESKLNEWHQILVIYLAMIGFFPKIFMINLHKENFILVQIYQKDRFTCNFRISPNIYFSYYLLETFAGISSNFLILMKALSAFGSLEC